MNQDKFSLLSVPLESCVFQEEHKLEIHSDYAGKDHMELPHQNKIKNVYRFKDEDKEARGVIFRLNIIIYFSQPKSG